MNNIKHKGVAFSLIELLISLITISCVVAAFTPVLTRKINNSMFVKSTSDKDKGLQIYATPGTYAFDIPLNVNKIYLSGAGGGGGGAGASNTTKTTSYTTNSTFTVPKGVYKIKLILSGAGGGGGGGYGRTSSEDCPYIKLPNMADNGRDLCYYSKNYDNTLSYGTHGSSLDIEYPGVSHIGGSVCFKYNNDAPLATTYYLASGSIASEKRLACTPDGAKHYCGCYLPRDLGWKPVECGGTNVEETEVHKSRLIKATEMKRIVDASPYPNYKYLTPQYLDIYSMGDDSTVTTVTRNYPAQNCKYSTGGAGGYCHHGQVPLDGGYFFWYTGKNGYGEYLYSRDPLVYFSAPYTYSGVPICVYEIRNWYPYGASGGSSGSKLEREIFVLPNDVLELTIGAGGSGGSAGNNGSNGGDTTVVHKRNGVALATYYAKGGIGGTKATSTSFGVAANYTPSCSTGGNCTLVVSDNNGLGYSGTELNGGSGAGNIQGGTPDIQPASAGSNTSLGGGGGFCNRISRTPSSCQKGGSGASGKIDLTYSIALPGGGGGAGASAGVLATGDNKEIELSVVGGDRLVVIVGKGGLGGNISMAGSSGSSTIVGENDIVFGYGSGGSIPTNTQISSLQGGSGGSGGSISISSSIKSKIKMDSINNYKGNSGLQGGIGKYYSITNNSTTTIPTLSTITPSCPDYGFDGGLGATTYLRYFGMGIGGGSYLKYDTTKGITTTNTSTTTSSSTSTSSTTCNANSKDGSSAKSHAPAKNQFGGEGGGGGGINPSSTTLGKGGDGGDGYLRIRWGG